MQVLIFHLDRSRFAVRVFDVQHVLRAVAVTSLPGSPPVVMGVVDVGGAVVPVFNLRRRFGLPDEAVSPDHNFVLVRANARAALLHVDRVERVADLDMSTVRSASSIVPGLEHVAGIAQVEEGLVLIHDLERFLSPSEGDDLDIALQSMQA